jgi:hypothetical protein
MLQIYPLLLDHLNDGVRLRGIIDIHDLGSGYYDGIDPREVGFSNVLKVFGGALTELWVNETNLFREV